MAQKSKTLLLWLLGCLFLAGLGWSVWKLAQTPETPQLEPSEVSSQKSSPAKLRVESPKVQFSKTKKFRSYTLKTIKREKKTVLQKISQQLGRCRTLFSDRLAQESTKKDNVQLRGELLKDLVFDGQEVVQKKRWQSDHWRKSNGQVRILYEIFEGENSRRRILSENAQGLPELVKQLNGEPEADNKALEEEGFFAGEKIYRDRVYSFKPKSGGKELMVFENGKEGVYRFQIQAPNQKLECKSHNEGHEMRCHCL